MLIRIDEIKEGGLVLSSEEKAEDFPVLAEVAAGGEVGFPALLQVSLRAVRIHGLVEVEGRIETCLKLSCGRCLKDFEAPLVLPFALTFSSELPEPAPDSEEDGVELRPEDMGLIPFEGDQIDLREAIGEQVVMGVPLRPLCNELCRGLCPQCGADLNLGDCGCEIPGFNNKFAVLKAFKAEKKERK